ncbi:MAG: glycosyltransferase family 2 protein [Candidatus Omnitrophota bacterium]|nr:glycosyltransferase family 2 protein [Candidatus Omnitrophota bacterium]
MILSKNEEKHIDSTLDMVFKQNINKEYEVILIDSGSQDSTLDIARRYPIKVLEIPAVEFGHGRTRNFGARAANGEIIVFLNADATPTDECWLGGLVDAFNDDEGIAGVYSNILPRPDCNPLRSWEILNENVNSRQVRYIKDFNDYQRMKPREKRVFLSFNSISCAIKKDFLLKYQFKDIEFGEDLDWSKTVMEKGFKIVFEPQSAVLHSHNFYFSFTKTFKKYFDDSRINNGLLNIWSWKNCPLLIGHVAYKILKDAVYVWNLNKGVFYKIGWLFYSPVIRTSELFGIIAGINSKRLPDRLRLSFSLVSDIKIN